MSESYEPSYWAVIPAPVRYDTAIPANAKLLYAEITSLARKNGYCFASNAYFADLYGITGTSVRRLLKTLVDCGYIQMDVLRDEKTHEVVSRQIYVGINTREAVLPSAQKCAEGSAQKSAETSAQKGSAYIRNNSKEKNNTPIAPSGGTSESDMLFDRFWALYPRKANKKAARRAWDKLKPDLLLCSQMSVALKAQMRSEQWTRDGGQYIPYPSTWINGRRWEDEAPSAPADLRPARAAPAEEAWGWEQ